MKIAARLVTLFVWWLALAASADGARRTREADLPADLPEAKGIAGEKLDTPPRLTKRGESRYPEHLVANHHYTRGHVACVVRIDADGSVSDVSIRFASHPAFVAPAIIQVRGSEFSPATVGGKPVPSTAVFVQGFDVVDSRGVPVGSDPTRIPKKIAGLPPAFDYDVAPILISYCDPVFPRGHLERSVQGEAAVRLVIDANGKVAEAEILSASHPEFGAALLAAVETWTFRPASRQGQSTITAIDHAHRFLPQRFRRPVIEVQALKQIQNEKPFASVDALAAPLSAIYRAAPQYPRKLLAARPLGEAEVEFIVWEDGQVTLPKVVRSTHPEFGYAALNAIQQWVFHPPDLNGKPAAVVCTQTFTFKP